MRGKLGVIADVHGNALALAAVLKDSQRRGVDRLVDLGDTLYGPMEPLECYRLFRNAPIVAGVSGNQDRKLLEATADDLAQNPTLAFTIGDLRLEPVTWLRQLPPTTTIDGELFLCHGTPASDTTYLLEDVSSGLPQVRPCEEILALLAGVPEPVILCGHSHIPRMVQLPNGQLIVNPGSVGLPAYDDDQPVKHFMETYSPHASYAILEPSQRGWEASFHRVVYDWEQAASQARRLGKEDWAQGIAFGRMNGSLARDLREHPRVP